MATMTGELLIVLGYFPARRPCVRRFSRRSSLPWAVATLETWLSEGAERVQVQRRTVFGRRVVLERLGSRLLMLRATVENERFCRSW